MELNSSASPKVVVIGAGSLFFGRQAIWQMVHSPYLQGGTLALVDKDPSRLDRMAKLAEMVIAENNAPLCLEAATDWRDVLPGTDFVVLSFAENTVYYRGLDCAISEKYGIRMCSGDTIGPGGIFRTMRELPIIMDCVRDIERLCPNAWVINYINPSAVNGIALMRYAPNLKTFALCDSLHMPHVKRGYAIRAGIISSDAHWLDAVDEAFDMRIAGVNHFTWMLKAEYQGSDVMPAIAESMRQDGLKETNDHDAKGKFNYRIGYQLYDIFGKVPTCIAHTKEYMRYWQGGSKLVDNNIPPLSIWETDARYKWHESMWDQVDSFISGKTPISAYMTTFGPDHATDIIENMVGNLGKPFYVNTLNRGAVSNMADDAFLELLSDVNLDGVKPRPVGEMPRGLRGMQETILDTHELIAEAVVKGNYALLRRAMMTDPLTNSIADADAILKELMEAEREVLPEHWFEPPRRKA
jgi:alpha-galactosidase/6-phospho-beta-glucosidase family protein